MASKPKKRTEKDRAYDREYQRKRRARDPEYKERQRQRQKAWRAKNPDYDKNRYQNDPEYAEARKAARRKNITKTLSIANARNNAVGNGRGRTPTIRKSDGYTCANGANGRRQKQKPITATRELNRIRNT